MSNGVLLQDSGPMEDGLDELYGNEQQYMLKVKSNVTAPTGGKFGGDAMDVRRLSLVDDTLFLTGTGGKKNKPTFKLSSLNLPSTKYSAVRALLFTLSTLTGQSPEEIADKMDKSFYEVGGNSKNTLATIVCFQHYKFKIDVLDFLKAKTLREIVMRMCLMDECETRTSWHELKRRYSCRPMKVKNLHHLLKYFGSYNIKPDTEKVTEEWEDTWKAVIKKGHHYVVVNNSDDSVWGIVLNFDVNDDSHCRLIPVVSGRSFDSHDILQHSYRMSATSILIELLQFVGENMQNKGKLVHPCFFINKNLPEPEKVALMIFMEVQNFENIKKKKYEWVVTHYPDLLQAQVERQIMGFEVLSDSKLETENIGEHYRYVICAKKT